MAKDYRPYIEVGQYNEQLDSDVNIIEIGAELDDYSPIGYFARDTIKEFPISYGLDVLGRCHINISYDYYEANKGLCNAIICSILKCTSSSDIGLLLRGNITEEMYDAIMDNSNIQQVALRKMPYVDKERLSSEYVKKLDEIAVSKLDLESFVRAFKTDDKGIVIKTTSSDEELKYLAELFKIYPQNSVLITGSAISQVRELLRIIFSLNVIIDDANMYANNTLFNYSGYDHQVNEPRISYNMEKVSYSETLANIQSAYNYLFQPEQYPGNEFPIGVEVGFYIAGTGNILYINQMKKRDEILSSIMSEVNKLDLTPLEAYMFFYDVVKLFKEYKHGSASNYFESRFAEFVLFNECIVCAGYSSLLEMFADNYNNKDLKVGTYNCQNRKHVRCLVAIRDEFYGVSGLFIADPTFDSIKAGVKDYKDLYKHFLLSKKQMDAIDGDFYGPDCTDVMFRGGKESLYQNSLESTRAWGDATYLSWFMRHGRAEKNAFFVISDPYEIEQKKVGLEVIEQVRKNLYRKLLCQKDTSGFYEFLCSHFFVKDHQEHKVEEMLRTFISNHMPQEPQVELPKLY